MSVSIVPALIPKSAEAVRDFTDKVTFCHEIQIDVVDGKFVSDVSWPYSPIDDLREIKPYTDKFTLEVDLMVSQPVEAAKSWLNIEADMLVFHVESLSLEEFVKFTVRAPYSLSIGVACHGDTSLETLFEYAESADYIQLMGIRDIGRQGELFNESVLEKISACKKRFPNKPVSIDGSVNEHTIAKLVKAGADRLVSGSAILGQPDVEAAYNKLVTLSG